MLEIYIANDFGLECRNVFEIDHYIERISHFVLGFRKRKGLTQQELSNMTRLSESNLSRIEQKKKDDISLYELVKLARLANFPLSDFFYYLEKQTHAAIAAKYPWQEDVISIVASLNPKLRLTLLEHLNKKKTADLEELFQLLYEACSLDERTLKNLISLLTSINIRQE